MLVIDTITNQSGALQLESALHCLDKTQMSCKPHCPAPQRQHLSVVDTSHWGIHQGLAVPSIYSAANLFTSVLQKTFALPIFYSQLWCPRSQGALSPLQNGFTSSDDLGRGNSCHHVTLRKDKYATNQQTRKCERHVRAQQITWLVRFITGMSMGIYLSIQCRVRILL